VEIPVPAERAVEVIPAATRADWPIAELPARDATGKQRGEATERAPAQLLREELRPAA
jgi:hypothetical protein